MALRQKSYRMMFRYWLDAAKDDELALADYCEDLKQTRSFTSTIRQALTLVRDLREGRLDSLFAMFPWILGWLEERAEAIAEAKLRANGSQIDELGSKLEHIERLLIGRETPVQFGYGEHLKRLPAGQDDDFSIEIKEAAGNPKIPGWNYAGAMARLHDSFDHLDLDCLRYLLDEGKLQLSQLKPKTLEKLGFTAQNTVPITGVGIKKMKINVDLPIPKFDDEEDLMGLEANNG